MFLYDIKATRNMIFYAIISCTLTLRSRLIDIPDRAVCEDDRVFLAVFEHHFSPGVEPHPLSRLTFNPKVHGLDLLCVNH